MKEGLKGEPMLRAMSIDQDPLTCRSEVQVRDGRDVLD